MEKKYIKIEHLYNISQEDFAHYGQIVGLCNKPPLEDFENLKYYNENINLGPVEKNVEEVSCGLLICKERKPGEPIVEFERHMLITETFIPLNGEGVIFVLAPADNSKDKPDTEKIRIFLLDGSLGVLLHKGTWHWPPMPLKRSANIILLTKGNLSGDTNFADIGLNVYPVF